ncbi:hypothetical protein P9857_17075, partial [Anoxybacillus geothermalis]|nr:hypothetical protein [Anoxybacillus geothermalis]
PDGVVAIEEAVCLAVGRPRFWNMDGLPPPWALRPLVCDLRCPGTEPINEQERLRIFLYRGIE